MSRPVRIDGLLFVAKAGYPFINLSNAAWKVSENTRVFGKRVFSRLGGAHDCAIALFLQQNALACFRGPLLEDFLALTGARDQLAEAV